MAAVQIYASFEQLPQAVCDLFEEAGSKCFFHSLPWYRTFVENALDASDRVRLYCVASPHQPGTSGAAIVTCVRGRGSSPLGARHLHSLSNYYTSLFSPVWEKDGVQYAAGALANAIASDSAWWDVVELKPLDVNSPLFGAMVSAFDSAGFLVQTFFCFGNWYLPVSGRTFAEYEESLPPAVRNTLSRKKKRLERSGNARIEIITGGEQLDASIRAYEAVYGASWKKPEPFPTFVPALMRTCAEMGSLRLGIVY